MINAICSLALALMIAVNLANINPERSSWWFPQSVRSLANRTLLIQEFKLFGHPPQLSPSFEYPTTLVDGDQVDLFEQLTHPMGFNGESVYDYFGTQHWRRIHSNLISDPQRPAEIVKTIRYHMLDRFVNKWNESRDPERHVKNSNLIYIVKEIKLNDEWGEPVKTVWAQWPGR